MFGNYDEASKIQNLIPRDPSNFNWGTIFMLAVVIFIYYDIIYKKEWKTLIAGISLYSVHWLCEICNALIAKIFGYPLWAVTQDSSSFILLIGVSVELSFMFSIAGMIAWRMLPADKTKKILGLPSKWFVVLSMSILFSIVEIFLHWTGKFVWVYPWWGAILVCITVYIPFFIAAVFVPDAPKKFIKIFLPSLIALNIILLSILIPLGII